MAAWLLVGGAAFARSGFFSPQGAYGMIGLFAFFVWLLVTSALTLRASPEQVPTAAAVPAG